MKRLLFFLSILITTASFGQTTLRNAQVSITPPLIFTNGDTASTRSYARSVGGGAGTTITNNLTTSSTGTALDAAQGKVLKDAQDINTTNIATNTAGITTNRGSITALQNIAVSRRAYGIVVPVFKTLGKFDYIGASLPATPFAIHSSGSGIVSSVGGTNADGYIRLPQEVTGWNVTRTDWLVSWDMTESGASMTLGIGEAATGYMITLANSGGNLVITWPSGATKTGALTGTVSLSVSITSGNGGVTCSVSVLGLPTLVSSNVYRVPVYEYAKLVKTKLFYAYFKTNTTTSKITGFSHGKNSWDGDPVGALLTQSVVLHGAGSVYNLGEGGGEVEHDNMVIIPTRSNLATPLKVAHFFHNRTGTYATFIDVTSGDNGETARQLLNSGYAIIATTGGTGTQVAEKDYWGNDVGTERAGEVFDAINRNVKNIGKEYLVGWSMGGVSCSNYLRRYPERVSVIWLWNPVMDMEETGTNSVQATAALKNSIDLAYTSFYLSLVASNTADPQTDGGTNWRQVSGPGELPNIGVRNYTITTVGTAGTNSSNIALASATRIYPGDVIYFKYSGQTRTVTHQATGQASNVRLDAPVTVAVGDPVSIIRSDNRSGYDYTWINRGATEWTASTQPVNVFLRRKSAHPELDIKAYNPIRFADLYAGLGVKFHIMVGGDGTSTGNDGILNNAPMFAFRDAVNAINSSLVTIVTGPSGHLGSTTLTASDAIPFFNAN